MKAAIIMLICIGAIAALIAPFWQTAENEDAIGALVALGLFVFWPLFYLLPAIAAKGRQNSGAIFLLNVLLGWTFIGWVAALVWAAATPRRGQC